MVCIACMPFGPKSIVCTYVYEASKKKKKETKLKNHKLKKKLNYVGTPRKVSVK